MAYATNLQFAQRSGLGLRIVDENVGTGDNAETDFDLDKGNVVDGSFTISYAASGSNTFTALTETTHYTIHKESGRIVLEAAGVTAVGTNIVYATYWYTDSFSDSVITALIAAADSEIQLLTNRTWNATTSVSEYRSGRSNSDYPTTDEPYQTDWDEPDKIILKEYPVIKVDQVFFLAEPIAVSLFYNYNDDNTTYTDKTDDVNSSTEAPFIPFDDSPATADYIYIGSSQRFLGLDVNLDTDGAGGTPAIDWEYYNGTTWADITETDVDTGASTFEASGKFTWTYPYGWDTTSVNSSSNYYWIRGNVTSVWSTTDPQIATVTILDSISETLEPRQYSFRTNGILHFRGKEVLSGTDNIRIDYQYGSSSTPTYITELSIMMASVKAYINLSGGSYDDATSYTLGSKSVTIGEVYVNIREVISQFKTRIDEILKSIGKRADIIAI
jgi:hypothetical protein